MRLTGEHKVGLLVKMAPPELLVLSVKDLKEEDAVVLHPQEEPKSQPDDLKVSFRVALGPNLECHGHPGK